VDDDGPVLQRLRDGDDRPSSNHLALAVQARDRLSLFRTGQHLMRQLDDGLPLASRREVDDEAGQTRADRHAFRAADAFLVVDPRRVVDVVEGDDRSRRAARSAGVARDALGAFDDDESVLFRLPERQGRLFRSRTAFHQDSAVEESLFVRHGLDLPGVAAALLKAATDLFPDFPGSEVAETLPVGRQPRVVVAVFDVTQRARRAKAGQTTFDHGRRGLFDSRSVSGNPDVGLARPHVGVATRHVAAEFRHELHVAARLPEQFRRGREADGKADDVAVDPDGLPFESLVAHGLDDRTADDVLSQGFDDGVAKQDRHAETTDLRRMNPVTADLRHEFDDSSHVDSRLHELVADDEADVARSDHENPLARRDSVDVHERLDRTRAVDARKVVLREGDETFHGPRGHDDAIRLDPEVVLLSSAEADHSVLLVVTQHRGVDVDVDALLEAFQLLEKELSDLVAPRSRPLVFGTEEFMGLLDELSSQLEVAVHQGDLRTPGGRLQRRRETGRAAADDQYFRRFHPVRPPLAFDEGHDAPTVLRLDLHAGLQRRHAGPNVRHAVDNHEAGRAFPDGTEKTTRLLALRRDPVDTHSVGVKRCCDRLAFESLELPAVEAERDLLRVTELKDRMLMDQSHERRTPLPKNPQKK